MMNIEAFKKAYNESRNGTDGWTRHPLAPYFVYSEGVKECAEAGCYWLLDVLATELSKVFRKHPEGYLMVVKVAVKDGGARIEGSFSDDLPPPIQAQGRLHRHAGRHMDVSGGQGRPPALLPVDGALIVSRPYTPRRATKRWLEGAPEYVLDVFDHGPKVCDRYDVYFGGSELDDTLLKTRQVHYLAMSANPSHPQGFSQWGRIYASYHPSHRRIRWLDLPENLRQHVARRVKE